MATSGTIADKNLVLELGDTTGITLVAGTYTAGTIIIHDGTSGSLGAVDGTDATQRVGVLLDDVDTTVSNAAIVATGTFNLNKITFGGGQDYAAIGGVLQDKDIFLKTFIKE